MVSPEVGGNDDVAERIRRERELRGWSYRELERRLADVGVQVSSSALHRIEHGTGPQKTRSKISVDELVGFAEVFGLTVPQLLEPADWIKEQRIRKLVRSTQRAAEKFEQGIIELIDCWRQMDWVDSPDEFEVITSRLRLDDFRLTIPSAGGLEEAARVVLALAEMLGAELMMQRYRQRMEIAYPDLAETIEIVVPRTTDWPSYLEALESAVDGFVENER